MSCKQRHEEAVSPVVGVMLMLVVTIIIAAVVSAFAGITGASDKAPNVVIDAGYSQTGGMWIENQGPDDISTFSTTVMVRLSDSFGNSEHMVWVVNKSTISDKDTTGLTGSPLNGSYWLRPEGYTGVKSFKVGERHYILPPYHEYSFLQPGAGSAYRLNSTANQGNSFWVELSDQNGKVFAKTKVKIEP